MISGGKRISFLLFAGDVAAFAVALYLTLWLRYGVTPSSSALAPFLAPFALLFAFWILVFYSAGLYGKRVALFPSRVPDALFKVQIVNIIFAALFFFFVPAFGITPKTILALYLVVSLVCIFFWRFTLYPRLSLRRRRERALLLADGAEADELFREVNGNPRYGITFDRLPPDAGIADASALLVVDKKNVDRLHLLGRSQFVAFEDLYEEVFDRVPLSQLSRSWFLENVAPDNSLWYAATKRLIDLIGGLVMGVITLVAIPFVFIAERVEGPGPLFIRQERFGQDGAHIGSYKFRSMQKNVSASGQWTHEGANRVTRVGAFLRRTSLDEFPQFINVLRGEISLVGPRNDILGLGQRLAEVLPYYDARYLVKPGITGWAQINQQYEPGNASPQSVEETKVRLAYDFYYLRHRSLGLDIMIALKTVKRMFFRVSSW